MTFTDVVISIGFIMGIVLLSPVAGYLTHEGLHWLVGFACGSGPRFSGWIGKWIFRIPTSVSISSPALMTICQIKLLGGIVFVFPFGLILFSAAALTSKIDLNLISLGMFGFLVGGMGISEKDIIAFRFPETWQHLAQGESVDLNDLINSRNN